MAPPFRLSTKNLFLTYPQCNGSREGLVALLQQKLGGWGIEWYIVAQEQHADGHNHLHAAIGLTRKCDIRNPNALDYEGSHGNYQSARDPAATVRYCQKDDENPLTFGELPTDSKAAKKRALAALATAETADEFMANAQVAMGAQYYLGYERLEYYTAKKFKTVAAPYTPTYTSFNTVPELDAWFNESLAHPRPEQVNR